MLISCLHKAPGPSCLSPSFKHSTIYHRAHFFLMYFLLLPTRFHPAYSLKLSFQKNWLCHIIFLVWKPSNFLSCLRNLYQHLSSANFSFNQLFPSYFPPSHCPNFLCLQLKKTHCSFPQPQPCSCTRWQGLAHYALWAGGCWRSVTSPMCQEWLFHVSKVEGGGGSRQQRQDVTCKP